MVNINDVIDLAVKVGQLQAESRKSFRRDAIEIKSSHDYVSYVDRESEAMIVDALHRLLPEATFITEEQTIEQSSSDAGYQWIVDPLDGTTNYVHDVAPWCVCIALKHNGQLQLGVVYEVVRNEVFFAEKGRGAWVRHSDGTVEQLNVSTVDDLDQALVVVGFPYDAEAFRPLCCDMIGNLYGHCASIRSFGSAEAELCYVAAGRIDVYFESYLKTWDVSAGAIILQEAGGRISDYSGGDALWPSGRECLATNGALHDSLLRLLQ